MAFGWGSPSHSLSLTHPVSYSWGLLPPSPLSLSRIQWLTTGAYSLSLSLALSFTHQVASRWGLLPPSNSFSLLHTQWLTAGAYLVLIISNLHTRGRNRRVDEGEHPSPAVAAVPRGHWRMQKRDRNVKSKLFHYHSHQTFETQQNVF